MPCFDTAFDQTNETHMNDSFFNQTSKTFDKGSAMDNNNQNFLSDLIVEDVKPSASSNIVDQSKSKASHKRTNSRGAIIFSTNLVNIV